MAKASKRDFVVTVSDIPGTWRNFTDPAFSVEATKDRDGGSDVEDLIGGPATWEDIELTRAFDPIADEAWMTRLRKGRGRLRLTVTKQATDVNKIAIGEPKTWADCLLIGMKEPDVEDSGDVAEVTVTLSTAGPAE